MTQTEALARCRVLLDESSAGYWQDTDIYRSLDSGQSAVIQYCLTVEEQKKKIDPYYRHPVLAALINTDPTTATTVGSGEQEYNLPTGFLASYSAEYDSTGTGTAYGKVAQLLTYEEIKRRGQNSFNSATISNPYYYISGSKIGFFPQPSGTTSGSIIHKYYKQPAEVAALQTFTLRPETHEAIILYAVGKMLEKDGNNKATTFYQQYLNQLQML